MFRARWALLILLAITAVSGVTASCLLHAMIFKRPKP
jgi:hypothetical protein